MTDYNNLIRSLRGLTHGADLTQGEYSTICEAVQTILTLLNERDKFKAGYAEACAHIEAQEGSIDKLLKVVEAAKESLSIETPVFLVEALKELEK